MPFVQTLRCSCEKIKGQVDKWRYRCEVPLNKDIHRERGREREATTAVELLLVHIYPVVLALALSSYLGCLAPYIYVYIWLPFLPYAYYMWLPWFVLFLFLGFSYPESLPGDDVLCSLLPRPLPSVCFLFFSFLFRPCSSPICFGVTSSIL